MHEELRGLECETVELLLARGTPDANWNAVCLALHRFKFTHCNRYQIRRHLGGSRELHRVLAFRGARFVAENFCVGERYVFLVGNHRDVEGGLVGGLVKRRKGSTSVGGLELCDSIPAA